MRSTSLRPAAFLAFCLTLGICGMAVPVISYAASPVSCDNLNVTLSNDKNFYVFSATASGDTSSITGYTFHFGDHQSYTFTFSPSSAQSRGIATTTHTYQKLGAYTASVQANVTAGGKKSTATSPACQAKVTNGPPTGALPSTGASGTFGLFAATSALGLAAHQLWLRRHRPIVD